MMNVPGTVPIMNIPGMFSEKNPGNFRGQFFFMISPYLLDRNLDHLVSVIRLADGPNYGLKYGEEEENDGEEKEGRET